MTSNFVHLFIVIALIAIQISKTSAQYDEDCHWSCDVDYWNIDYTDYICDEVCYDPYPLFPYMSSLPLKESKKASELVGPASIKFSRVEKPRTKPNSRLSSVRLRITNKRQATPLSRQLAIVDKCIARKHQPRAFISVN